MPMEREDFTSLLEISFRDAGLTISASLDKVQAIYHVIIEKRDTFLVLPTFS